MKLEASMSLTWQKLTVTDQRVRGFRRRCNNLSPIRTQILEFSQKYESKSSSMNEFEIHVNVRISRTSGASTGHPDNILRI